MSLNGFKCVTAFIFAEKRFFFISLVIIGLAVLTVEKPEHNFISFSFKNTFVVVVGLPRQIDSDHLVILKHKLFTNRFVPFSLRCRSLLFNIPKFMFSLFIKKSDW